MGDKLKYGNVKTIWEWRCGWGPVQLDTGTKLNRQTGWGDSHTSTPSPHRPEHCTSGGVPTTLHLQGCSQASSGTANPIHSSYSNLAFLFWPQSNLMRLLKLSSSVESLRKQTHHIHTQNPLQITCHPQLLQFVTQPYSPYSYSTFYSCNPFNYKIWVQATSSFFPSEENLLIYPTSQLSLLTT